MSPTSIVLGHRTLLLRLQSCCRDRVSEWVSIFLTTHQHNQCHSRWMLWKRHNSKLICNSRDSHQPLCGSCRGFDLGRARSYGGPLVPTKCFFLRLILQHFILVFTTCFSYFDFTPFYFRFYTFFLSLYNLLNCFCKIYLFNTPATCHHVMTAV